jgi:hypothetical protein
MAQYRKKPVVIDAVRIENAGGTNCDACRVSRWIKECADDAPDAVCDGIALYIPTLEGTMRADVGDWVIRDGKGEFYPCKPDIFEATYEPVVTRTTRPTVTELEAILNDEGTRNVVINPDGSVSTVEADRPAPEETRR